MDLLGLVVLLLTGFTACAGWPLRTTERSTRNFPLKRHVLLQVVQIQFPLLHRGDIPGTGTGIAILVPTILKSADGAGIPLHLQIGVDLGAWRRRFSGGSMRE